jgi:hypothetical protein
MYLSITMGVSVGLVLLLSCRMAVAECNFDYLRMINQQADQAYLRKEFDPLSKKQFARTMRVLLDLNQRGCALPSDDPDSVLFRQSTTTTPSFTQ